MAAVVLFFALDRYVVVGDDGVSLELPFMSKGTASGEDAETSAAPESSVTAELVVVDPDYDEVETDAGENLTAVNAVFVPAEEITAEGLAAVSETLAANGASALVLQLKGPDGQLMWASGVQEAYSYGTAGALDLAAYVTAWKEAGVYLAAQLSCCLDELMATRNPSLALKTADGAVYSDDNGYWLDPYNKTLRGYILSLAQELSAMGFDEILLADLLHPSGEGLAYSQAMTSEPDPVTAVDGFALKVTAAFVGSGTQVSVLCDADSLRNGLSAQTGQDPDFFFRVFDRVYCPTDIYNIGTDRDIALAHMETGDGALRFVPVLSSVPDSASWVFTG